MTLTSAHSDWPERLPHPNAWRSLSLRLSTPQPHYTNIRHIQDSLSDTSLTATMSDSTTQPADSNMDANDELDPTVEEEINHDATQANAMNIDGAAEPEPIVNGVSEPVQTFEARIPAKKDATLREFLGKMDEYAPIVRAYDRPQCATSPI